MQIEGLRCVSVLDKGNDIFGWRNQGCCAEAVTSVVANICETGVFYHVHNAWSTIADNTDVMVPSGGEEDLKQSLLWTGRVSERTRIEIPWTFCDLSLRLFLEFYLDM